MPALVTQAQLIVLGLTLGSFSGAYAADAFMLKFPVHGLKNSNALIYPPNIPPESQPDLPPDQSVPEPEADPGPYLKVINPIPGVNGVYQVDTGEKGTFNAYVDMTSDGGHWILVSHWIGSADERTFADLATKGVPIKSYTQDAARYPVLASGAVNTSGKVMFKSKNQKWTEMYGEWQTFPAFQPGYLFDQAGFTARTSTGQSVTLFSTEAGWDFGRTVEASRFGLFTQWGNAGVCGGADVIGDLVCPIMATVYQAHYDWVSVKQVFIKADHTH